jgi:hypothetical protein
MKRHYAFLLLLIVLAVPLTALSQVPTTLSYQGVLSDSVGVPKPDGIYTFTFRLYTSAGGGTPIWTEIKDINVRDGLFSTQLGDVEPFGSAVRFDSAYWLGIKAGAGSELQPLVPMNAVAYSMNSVKADTARYAMSAPVVGFVDSARIAGALPPNTVTSANIVDAAITGADVSPGAALSINTLATTGDVGLGTSAPERRLHVYESFNGAMGLKVENPSTGTVAQQRVELGSSAGLISFNPSHGTAPNVFRLYNNVAGGSMDFITTGSIRATITEGGKVGIGTTTPSTQAKVHVAGGDLAFDDNLYYGLKWVNGNALIAHIHRYYIDNRLYVTNKGTSNLTGVYLDSGGTSWISTSDLRLKENLKDAGGELSRVLRIPVREYNFKGSSQQKIGFVAQELYPIIPEVVSRGDEGEFTDKSSPWGIDYAGLTPILVKALQEQQRVIEGLEERIAKLEARLR